MVHLGSEIFVVVQVHTAEIVFADRVECCVSLNLVSVYDRWVRFDSWIQVSRASSSLLHLLSDCVNYIGLIDRIHGEFEGY